MGESRLHSGFALFKGLYCTGNALTGFAFFPSASYTVPNSGYVAKAPTGTSYFAPFLSLL